MEVKKLLVLLTVSLGPLVPQFCADAAVRYSVTDLGALSAGGSGGSAQAINDSGQIVGSFYTQVDEHYLSLHGFLYDGAMHDIGGLGGSDTAPYDINDSGQVVGYSETGTGHPHAFLYDGMMHDLYTLGGEYSTAYGINNSGVVVGEAATGGGNTHAFVYDGTMRDLGTPTGISGSSARAANEAGQIAGSGGLYDGTWHTLGTLPGGTWSSASGINNRGQIVGQADCLFLGIPGWNTTHAVLYDGTIHDLGAMPDGFASYATAINDSGLVVGYADRPGPVDDDHDRAFLYNGTTILDLNELIDPASGWTLYRANDINNSGEIVGYGSRGAFLLTPVPEPSSLACLALAILWLGWTISTRMRRSGLAAVLSSLALMAALAGAAMADEEAELISSETNIASTTFDSEYVTTAPPSGYVCLPAFPRFFWSRGCLPTSGAMIVGYYSNAGFVRMCKKKVGGSYTDYICPTGNHPSDNDIYLKSTDPQFGQTGYPMYPSRCAISATEKGTFGRGESDYGHADDYYSCSIGSLGCLTDPYVTHGTSPIWTRNYPWSQQGLHSDDCMADFMGTSVEYMRGQGDGYSWIDFGYHASDPNPFHGDPYIWTPATCSPTDEFYPYPNTPPETGNGTYSSTQIDANYGLGRYIVDFARYYSWESCPDGTHPYHDVWSYSSQYVNGCLIPDSSPAKTLQDDEGATEDVVKNEIDAGRPVIVSVVDIIVHSKHAFPVWGYKQEEGQPLQMLAYDTWNEDCVVNASTGDPYESTSYRIVPFPSSSQAHNTSYYSLERASKAPSINGRYWRVYGVSRLMINNHDRCPDALQSNQYPSNTEQNPYTETLNVNFSLTFDTGATNRQVHFTLDGTDPNPNSPYIAVNGSTGALHVSSDCNLKFRTYADAATSHPEDGYIAGKVIERTYWVSATKTNAREYADGDGIATGPMIVTRGTSESDHYCYVENQDRTSGIRVQVGETDTVTEGSLVSVVGRLATNTAGERFLDDAVVTDLGTPDNPVLPLGMPTPSLGGADFNYNSTTGAGQQGVTGGAGLNNIGLLVRTTGCVCSYTGSSFEMTDGSPQPITVISPDPPQQGYVDVTGVCSRQSDGNGGFKPVLLVRTTDDIVTYDNQTCSCGSQSNAPACSRREVPAVEATDMIAWALKQTDGTTVTVKVCGVRSASASGLLIDDGWMKDAARIWVPGNWTVEEWSTIDVTGVLTTLPDETRAITATQILIYTDPRGRPIDFPLPWRNHFGQLIEEWPYKQAAMRF